MNISSYNEWDPLKSVVVGSALGSNWPTELQNMETTWDKSPIPRGKVNWRIVQQTQKELDVLAKVLHGFGIKVHRPKFVDYTQSDGMYNYCPRDRLLIAGSTVIVPNMGMYCRNQEVQAYHGILDNADDIRHMPQEPDMRLDAANVCKLGDTLLVLENRYGTPKAIEWLRRQLPDFKIESWNCYGGVHIDSTIIPVREGLVILNGERVNDDNCPQVLKSWDKIYVNDVVERKFFRFPYASKWIGLNMLVVDPNCVIIDELQVDLIQQLESRGFYVIPMTLTHSRTLGGGFHCVTLDLEREAGHVVQRPGQPRQR